MSISVITPTIPERASLLEQCRESVAGQTLQPLEHLVGVDEAGEGPATVRNRLAAQAKGEWLAFLDDDDLLEPDHLLLLEAHSSDADVVYSYCSVEGRNFPINFDFDADSLRNGNYIPVTAMVRKAIFDKVGGFGDERFEDWGLWLRILDAGGRFVCVPTITWIYRFGLSPQRTFAGR